MHPPAHSSWQHSLGARPKQRPLHCGAQMVFVTVGRGGEWGGGQHPITPPPPTAPPVPTLLAVLGARPPTVPSAALVAWGACGTEHSGVRGGCVGSGGGCGVGGGL